MIKREKEETEKRLKEREVAGRKLKAGDMILCSDAEDVRKHLGELGKAGYGAVAHWPSCVITVTSGTEEEGNED